MLENLKRPERVTACVVRTILYKLSPDDYVILTDALADPLWSHDSLARGLRDNGLNVSPNSIKRHRAGLCSCKNGN